MSTRLLVHPTSPRSSMMEGGKGAPAFQHTTNGNAADHRPHIFLAPLSALTHSLFSFLSFSSLIGHSRRRSDDLLCCSHLSYYFRAVHTYPRADISIRSTENKMTTKAAASAAFRALAASRRSTRRFIPNKPIPSSTLADILSTTRTAPSGFNLQPTHTILVRDKDIKDQLANEAMLGLGNVYRTKDCSAMAVFLADLEVTKRIDRIYYLEKKSGCRDPNYMAVLPVAASFLTGEGHAATLLKQLATGALSPVQPMPSIERVESWSYKNTALSAMMYTMAAHSHGLGTCMMEGYDDRRAREILRVPDRYGMPIMVATGFEYEDEHWKEEEMMKRTPRLNMGELFFGNTFGEALDVLDRVDEEEEGGEED